MRLDRVGLCYRSGGSMLHPLRHWAIEDVSFEVEAGETLGIVGRNGSGKSTLLRIMSDVFEPDRGSINHFGLQASLLSLSVGFVPHLTGRQNAILGGLMLGQVRRSIVDKMDAIQEFSGLEDFFDRPVRMYSSGMRARLGFSVAIETDPDILLIDEVLGVGDFEFKRKSSHAIRERVNSDKTVVLVAHQPQIIRELCSRVIWIERGHVEMVGGSEEVLDAYQKERQRGKRELRKEIIEP